ncbi:dihydropyrimidine dehydrogenase [Halogeometricum borinquense]|uniref:Dihydropyrimidine dehydrogenase n=1 Tax=Halogeometricum borinquense TaxID=60847 RepID=A0A6C0UM81_9EURY|nr:tRNA-dihydrouridine synthase [Halogeometricum borinquense]QIB74989.1 dihydropyrimidine dehydrogenase [Halogeometricum borinquense]QIQ76033.1 dihydropyrimidine dehydrogenase [Halogeometricum borinquense]
MFDPRVALASLSGEADAAWARQAESHAGMAFLGGISLDDRSRKAARELVARDRNEFLPEDPFAFVASELDTLADADIDTAMNVRSATVGPVRRAARICADRDAILEVNAHCRQDELCAVGCGETLLRDTDRLCEYVAAAADEGATVSVKVRAEVEGVSLETTADRVADAGASILHVDSMDSEEVIADVSDSSLFVVANNEVRGEASVREYLGYGADAVSVGRPSTDPRVLRRVRAAVDDWFDDETGTSGEISEVGP